MSDTSPEILAEHQRYLAELRLTAQALKRRIKKPQSSWDSGTGVGITRQQPTEVIPDVKLKAKGGIAVFG